MNPTIALTMRSLSETTDVFAHLWDDRQMKTWEGNHVNVIIQCMEL